MSQHLEQYGRRKDEISIYEIIIKVKEYAFFLLHHWYILLLATIPFAYLNHRSVDNVKPTYNARMELLIKSKTTMKDNATIIQMVARLAHSHEILEKTLLEKVSINEQEDLLINHYIQAFKKNYPDIFLTAVASDFRIKNTDSKEFTAIEKEVYRDVIGRVEQPSAGFSNGFLSTSLSEKIGFISFNFSTPTPELSIAFLDELVDNLKNMYADNATHSEYGALTMMQGVIDSLKTDLDTEFMRLLEIKDVYQKEIDKAKLAESNDKIASTFIESKDNETEEEFGEIDFVDEEEKVKAAAKELAIAKQKRQKSSFRNQRRLSKRIQAYELKVELLKDEIVKGQEQLKLARFEYGKQAPLIVIVKQPRLPLKAYQPSVKWFLIKGAITGVFLAVVLLIIFKILKDTLEEGARAAQSEVVQENLEKVNDSTASR